jgi:hypothetical protein
VGQDSLVPLRKELPRLLLEPWQHYSLNIFIWLESSTLRTFFRGQNMARFHLNNSHKSIKREADASEKELLQWCLEWKIIWVAASTVYLSTADSILTDCTTVRYRSSCLCLVSLSSHTNIIIIANNGYKLHYGTHYTLLQTILLSEQR